MDRFSLLSRRLALPLAGLTSVGLLWLAVPGRTTPPKHTVPACCASGSDLRAEAAIATSAVAGSRTVVAPVHKQPAGKRPVHAPVVVTTAFAGGEPLDRDVSWPDATGPSLLRAAQPAAEAHPMALRPQQPATAAQLPKPIPQTPAPVEMQPSRADASPRVLQDPPLAGPVRPARAVRTRQLESIAQEADRHSRQGYELAGREAYYAARREFTTALRLVAQGLDTEHQTARHSRALAAALAAIAEAEDFIPPRDRLEADLNMADIVARHGTPVLKGAAENSAPIEAMKAYFTFAQEQLAVAVGSEVAGSMALHGLGKLHSALAGQSSSRVRAAESKAMTFFQAALLVDPRNYMASNDLGVLLARSGHYDEARRALEHSVSIRPQATGWRNLAQVYQRVGDRDRAARAEQLFQVAARAEAASQKQRTPAGVVQWVDPPAFAQTFAQTPAAREPLPVRQAPGKPSPEATGPTAQKPFSNLFEKR